VGEAIDVFQDLSKIIFTAKSNSHTAKYDDGVMVTEFKKVIGKSRLPLNSNEARFISKNGTLTFVVAIRTITGNRPVLFRTYDTPREDASTAFIWEVARATSAAPLYFEPITIDPITYSDGGLGANNPTEEAILEAYDVLPEKPIGRVVSIGTGHGHVSQLDYGLKKVKSWIPGWAQRKFPRQLFLVKTAKYCTDCLLNSETVHERVKRYSAMLGLNDKIFRFNPPSEVGTIELDAVDKMNYIIQMTESYIATQDHELRNCAKELRYPCLTAGEVQ
jgi:Patatin-like phospholipase